MASLFEIFKRWRASRVWDASTLGQEITHVTQKYFSDIPRLAALSEEEKREVINGVLHSIHDISAADNSFIMLRERLAGYVISYAEYTILTVTTEEKADSDILNSPYISGALHQYIAQLTDIPTDEQLGKIKWAHPDASDESLVDFCNTRGAVYHYCVACMNAVRIEMGDYDDKKDWLSSFIKAMLVWEEDRAREELELPSLFTDPLGGFKYSTFMNLVVNGVPNPRYEWEVSEGEDLDKV